MEELEHLKNQASARLAGAGLLPLEVWLHDLLDQAYQEGYRHSAEVARMESHWD